MGHCNHKGADDTMEKQPTNIKRIISSLYPFRKKIIYVFFTMLISTGISFVLPLLVKQLMDEGLLKNSFTVVVRYSLAIFAVFTLDRLINQLQLSLISYINNIFQFRWTSIALRKLMKLKIEYLQDKNFTEIMNNIKMDVAGISKITDQSFTYRIFNILKIIGGFIGLVAINYKLSILILAFIPVRYALTSYHVKIRKEIQIKYMEHSRAYSSWYGDRMSGIKEIKLGGVSDLIMKQFVDLQRNLVKIDMKGRASENFSMITETVLFKAIEVSIYIVGCLLVIRNQFTIGGLFAFVTYSMNVLQPISSLLNMKYELSKVMLAAERLFGFLDMDCETNSRTCKRLKHDELKGKIQFRNITYSYKEGKRALDDVSFEIKSGEKIGIVGLNGSGKTTLINILLRLYEPESGEIFIDDTNIKNIKLDDYRKAISVVSQDFHIFNATIGENISLFTKLTEEEIASAASQSYASDFIDKLGEGYNTRLGVQGSGLSGGEKQRLALTRAFAKGTSILILDEATSNFDAKYEKQINHTLLHTFKDKTILIITHKPYILEMLDRIVVMNNGAISGIGNHEQLNEQNEIYRKIIKQ